MENRVLLSVFERVSVASGRCYGSTRAPRHTASIARKIASAMPGFGDSPVSSRGWEQYISYKLSQRIPSFHICVIVHFMPHSAWPMAYTTQRMAHGLHHTAHGTMAIVVLDDTYLGKHAAHPECDGEHRDVQPQRQPGQLRRSALVTRQ